MPEILNLVYDSLCLTDIQLARDSIIDISISSFISLLMSELMRVFFSLNYANKHS